MQQAISRLFEKIQPEPLQRMIREAARTGKLKDGHPTRRAHWLSRAIWFGEAAVQLVTDAAETYDRRVIQNARAATTNTTTAHTQQEQRTQQEQNQHIRTKRETRYHSQHHGQINATTTVFEPDTTSNLSEEDIERPDS